VLPYDCPCGPRAIINHGVDGLFVEDGNQDEFIKQLQLLMSNETLRLEMGKKRSYK
jgi:glycosyltransferase involved in cell wall biosynthesis